MEYYIEFIVFQEFIVDFMILYITGKLLCQKLIFKRLLLATIVGVVYTVLTYSVGRDFLSYFAVKIAVSALLVTISFSPKKILDYIKLMLCLYLVSLVLLGIILLSYFMFDSKITIILIFTAIILINIVLKIVFREAITNKEIVDYLRDVEIHLNGNVVELVGYIDTGNELKDTTSNKPVIIVDIECVKNLLDYETFNSVKIAYEGGDYALTDLMLKKLGDYNLRLLKYYTISEQNKYMVGIVPHKTLIKMKDKSLFVDCVIGICPNKLCENGKFQALLYKKLLNWKGQSADADQHF